jgi:hypothetical protein
MSATASFRLPGVYFLPAPRQPSVALPPLDVAGFVGFATRGPLNVPVPVSDLASFDAIFGGAFAVARDANGKPVYAYLRDAVAGFFAAGGTRCYVSRAAGQNAVSAQFALPGMIGIDALGDIGAATIGASSAGAWGGELSLGTIQTTTLLPPAAFTVSDGMTLTWATGGAPQAIQQGDVLRLTFANDNGRQWLFPVAAVGLGTQDVPQALLTAGSVWPATVALAAGGLPTITAVQQITASGLAPLVVAADFSPLPTGIGLSLSGRDRLLPGPGDVLLLDLADGSQQVLTVADAQARPASGSLPEASVALSATGMVSMRNTAGTPPVLPTGSIPSLIRAERLQFTLRIQYGSAMARELNTLGFNAAHPRFWGDIAVAESGSLAGGATASSGTAQAQQSQVLGPGDATLLYADLFGVQRADLDWTDPRLFTVLPTLLAPASAAQTYLPVGMALIGSDADLVTADASQPPDDDLGTFDAQLFLDPNLIVTTDDPAPAAIAPATLSTAATDLYFLQDIRLKGIHSLMFVDEVALIAAPDAVQTGWTQTDAEPVVTLPPAAVVVPSPAAGFTVCVVTPTVLAVDPTGGPMAGGTLVTITGTAFQSADTVTVSFNGQAASAVAVIDDTTLTCVSPQASIPGPVAVTVSNSAGSTTLAAAFLYWQSSTTPPLAISSPSTAANPGWLQAVHVALIGLCQARGDAVAILALPLDFQARDCINWLQNLRQNLGLPRHGKNYPYATDIADLSFAAVYHPWLLVPDPNGPAGTLRPTPPDGAMCGTIAASEIASQTWVAPANIALAGVLDLQPTISDDDWANLFALGFNLVRHEAKDFRVMSAHTLADDQSLLQLSARRLLIQLRKAVLQRGEAWVFASNTDRFRQRVGYWLEDMLRVMFNGGAFAGTNQQSSYRVIVDNSVNTQSSIDAGQIIAQIMIAPSQPMEFITVLLTRTGQGQLQAAEA